MSVPLAESSHRDGLAMVLPTSAMVLPTSALLLSLVAELLRNPLHLLHAVRRTLGTIFGPLHLLHAVRRTLGTIFGTIAVVTIHALGLLRARATLLGEPVPNGFVIEAPWLVHGGHGRIIKAAAWLTSRSPVPPCLAAAGRNACQDAAFSSPTAPSPGHAGPPARISSPRFT
jgi:hypothetical protein